MKKAILIIIYFVCAVVLLPVVILASPAIIGSFVYALVNDWKQDLLDSFIVGMVFEILALLVILLFLSMVK